ncbi:hypothetical protein TNCV_3147481 [Trichonephila clavipes]|nr:hypothetical protein TNCV_3147481 [Trichonephila clavipes]
METNTSQDVGRRGLGHIVIRTRRGLDVEDDYLHDYNYYLAVEYALSFGRPDCKNSPQSHIVRVYDAGHDKSGVFHSAEWHDGDWSNDGIREAWLCLHAEIVEEEIEVVSPSIVPSGNFAELNRTVTCMVLNSCPCHDEFRGPRSDYVRQAKSYTSNNSPLTRCTFSPKLHKKDKNRSSYDRKKNTTQERDNENKDGGFHQVGGISIINQAQNERKNGHFFVTSSDEENTDGGQKTVTGNLIWF